MFVGTCREEKRGQWKWGGIRESYGGENNKKKYIMYMYELVKD